MANGSFYQNGLPLSTSETGLGNVPAAPGTVKPANSSFYLSGSVYNTLANQDALTALLTADTALVVADLVAANVAAANSAASAAAAATSLATLTTTALLKANNLSDLANVATAKGNLSLVKADVGLGNVDNTSDVNKPVSTAQATADALVASNAATATALKANIASPTLTGVPAAPTAAALTNNTQLATTAYADAAVSTLSGTVNTALALKAPLASPALTGTPTAPTAAALDNTTKLATTAYADAAVAVEATAARNAANLTSGTVPAARMPALTGDVTTVAGAVATTIAANAVTNAKLATMAALTVKTNITGGAAVPTDSTLTAVLDAALGATRGMVLTRGAAAWGALGVGTNTQVLSSNGTDALWAAAAGGGGTETFALHTGIGGL